MVPGKNRTLSRATSQAGDFTELYPCRETGKPENRKTGTKKLMEEHCVNKVDKLSRKKGCFGVFEISIWAKAMTQGVARGVVIH